MTDGGQINVIFDVLRRDIANRKSELKENNQKLAHYTTAETALKIIESRTIRFRNATLMNDFQEIKFGRDAVRASYEKFGGGFTAKAEQLFEGITEEINKQIELVESFIRSDTYLTSLSVYDPDDFSGKLSMWRAYGGPIAGVAIVFNTDVVDGEDGPLQSRLQPVRYGQEGLDKALEGLFRSLLDNVESIKDFSREAFACFLALELQMLMLSTKNRDFLEEREWRVIHNPLNNFSDFIRSKPVSINGIPQIVYEANLEEYSEHFHEFSLENLIHKIIIGPCRYPDQVRAALELALEQAKVLNVRDRIIVSSTPLRQG